MCNTCSRVHKLNETALRLVVISSQLTVPASMKTWLQQKCKPCRSGVLIAIQESKCDLFAQHRWLNLCAYLCPAYFELLLQGLNAVC